MSYLPINLHTQADTAAHLVLCASVSHFLSPSAGAVPFTSAAAILRLCSSSERRRGRLHLEFQGFGGGNPRGGQGKSILLPFLATVCHHTHDHTCSARDTPEQPTHQHQRNLSTFLFFSSPSPSYSALLCWDVVSMVFFTLWSFSELRHHFLVFPCTH